MRIGHEDERSTYAQRPYPCSTAVTKIQSRAADVPVANPSRLGRNFHILVSGSFISMLGDQFTLIALPWLVLKLTGNAVALGAVLATMAVPRAALMLLGGAVVDRLSPRRVLLVAKLANATLIAMLAFLVWNGSIQLWMVYLLAFGIGTATAFAYPAGSSILPQVVALEKLNAANAFMMSLRQIGMFVGPALAGVVMAVFATHSSRASSSSGVPGAAGIAVAFAIDATSFLASIWSLMIIRLRVPERRGNGLSVANVWHSIREGLQAVWRDPPLRIFMLYIAAVSIFVGGSLQIGLPILANERLDWGAASLGAMVAGTGTGTLVGMIMAGRGMRLVTLHLGVAVIASDACVGLVLVGLGFVHTTLVAAAMLLTAGIMNGFVQVSVLSWIQRRVAPDMMGRTMSLLMLAFMGLGPIAAALGGIVAAHIGVIGLFVGAGGLLTIIALLSLGIPAFRAITNEKNSKTVVSEN